MVRREKIETLEGLRGIAFMSVFISHAGIPELECIGQWGVSVFLILSGFLLTYNYWNKNKIRNGLVFAIRKLLYLYPLHIICMVAMIAMRCIFNPYSDLEIGMVIRKAFHNILMIQEWYSFTSIPSINPVSWYMCILLLTYACFPTVLTMMERKWNKRIALMMIFGTILMQVLMGLIAICMLYLNKNYNMGLNRDILWWITYFYPPTRFLDFFIGCNLAFIFMNNRHEFSEFSYTIIELLSIILTIVCCTLGSITYLKEPNSWYTYVLIYTIPSFLLIYFFAVGKGSFSKATLNRFTSFFSKVSPFGFLIHYVVFEYIWCIVYQYCHNFEYVQNNRWWLNLSIGLFVTILLSEFYLFILKKLPCLKISATP